MGLAVGIVDVDVGEVTAGGDRKEGLQSYFPADELHRVFEAVLSDGSPRREHQQQRNPQEWSPAHGRLQGRQVSPKRREIHAARYDRLSARPSRRPAYFPFPFVSPSILSLARCHAVSRQAKISSMLIPRPSLSAALAATSGFTPRRAMPNPMPKFTRWFTKDVRTATKSSLLLASMKSLL